MAKHQNLVWIKHLLLELGLDVPPRTAERFTKVLAELNRERESYDGLLRGIFPTDYDDMVIEKDIPIYSYCMHHILPWFGRVHIGYIAHLKLLGISKFTRIANYYSVGITLQEDVTKLITDFFVEHVSEDCIVVVEALHTCKVARGVENPFSRSITIDARGLFRKGDGPRLEFFSQINK